MNTLAPSKIFDDEVGAEKVLQPYLSAEGELLACLAAGPKRASEIYANISVSQPSASRCLKKMTRSNLLVIEGDDTDSRVRLYNLNRNHPDFEKIRVSLKSIIDSLESLNE